MEGNEILTGNLFSQLNLLVLYCDSGTAALGEALDGRSILGGDDLVLTIVLVNNFSS